MTSLARGLYEVLLTQLLEEQLRQPEIGERAEVDELRNAEAADRIAMHLAKAVEAAIENVAEEDRAAAGTRLSRRLIDVIAGEAGESVAGMRLEEPARVLRAIRRRLPDASYERIEKPLIPLLDTTLLTNAPGEPGVGHQVRAEIASADRIDLVMAFIRRTGINPLMEALRRHVDDGKSLRVLTTAYTGSTEAEALEALIKLGAQVRVSYDTTSTRLHAKAWLFHRDSGYSTAYVGSSNLTHSAQVTGLEWNVRVSAARNRAVIEKIG